LSYLLNPSRKEHTLEDLSRERLGIELPALPVTSGRQKGAPLSALTAEELGERFGSRAAAARKISAALWPELETVGVSKLAREIELPLIPVLAAMEAAGVKLDVAAVSKVGTQVDAEAQRVLEAIHHEVGHAFNVSSNAQLADVLYSELKLPVL